MSPEYLAKSNPETSFLEHTNTVCEVAETVIEQSSQVLSDRLEIELSTLHRLMQYCAKYHDAGKLHPEWQQACRNSINGVSASFPPHSARSACYAYNALQTKNDISDPQHIAIVLAILHHHTAFTERHMRPSRLRDSLAPGSREFGEMVDAIDEIETVDNFEFPTPDFDNSVLNTFGRTIERIRDLNAADSIYDSVARLVTVLHSILVQSDQYASALHTQEHPNNDPTARLFNDDFELFDTLRPFQQQIETNDAERMVGIAGCGEGKTHAALQWGASRVEENQIDRLIFAMPTRVTSNNLLLEVTGSEQNGSQGHLPAAKGALYHSATRSFYQSKEAEQRWDVSTEVQAERQRRWFQRPITVTTIDHVLSTLVNAYPNANVAKGNLLRAGVVFDEIHAYDERLTANLRNGLQRLNDYDVPWFLMSATVPPHLRNRRPISNVATVESKGRLATDEPPRSPFSFSVREEDLTSEVVNQWYQANPETNRLLVIKNTVAEARKVAKSLQSDGYDVEYFSSEFPRADRPKKEEAIRESFRCNHSDELTIAVTTQICEISLDLSADALLTDLAPLDSILQRAGRLHRDGVKKTAGDCRHESNQCSQCQQKLSEFEYQCIVFAPTEINETERWPPYAVEGDGDMWEILARTKRTLSDIEVYDFTDTLRKLEAVYQDWSTKESQEFYTAAQADALYGPDRQIGGNDDSKVGSTIQLRNILSYRRDVLASEYTLASGETWEPEEHWMATHDCPQVGQCGLTAEHWTECDELLNAFFQKFAVPVPSWWISAGYVDLQPLQVDGHISQYCSIADVEYTYTDGIIPPEGVR